MVEIVLKDLPKISLNDWYSGSHWSKRKKIKDQYKWIVLNQFKGVFPKSKSYSCKYSFSFSKRPLDASNCIAMTKLIEDIIFEDDKWDIVRSLTIESFKGKEDYLKIEIDELTGDN